MLCMTSATFQQPVLREIQNFVVLVRSRQLKKSSDVGPNYLRFGMGGEEGRCSK